MIYNVAPPPCSAGIIMTTTITIAAKMVKTLCILLFNIEVCVGTNIVPP